MQVRVRLLISVVPYGNHSLFSGTFNLDLRWKQLPGIFREKFDWAVGLAECNNVVLTVIDETPVAVEPDAFKATIALPPHKGAFLFFPLITFGIVYFSLLSICRRFWSSKTFFFLE